MALLTAPEGTFTVAEFLRLPLEGRRWELLNGTVVQMEPHAMTTSILTSDILYALDRHVRERDLGVILGPGLGFRLWPEQETVRVTDASFTPRNRIAEFRAAGNDFPWTAPDLIVEVFSPFERLGSVLKRIVMFLQAGTKMAWLIDEATRTTTVFRSDAPPKVLHEADILLGSDVLQDFAIPVAALFADLDTFPAVTDDQVNEITTDSALPEQPMSVDAGNNPEAPPMDGSSGWTAMRIGARLERFVDAHQLGWAVAGTGFVLSSDGLDVRAPAVAVVLRERLSELPSDPVPLAPDLAVNVLSSCDRMADVLREIGAYLAAEVSLVWLADPSTHRVTVFRPDRTLKTLGEGELLDGGDVLPGFSLPVAEVFG
jgi:Uma2 family endonuclease